MPEVAGILADSIKYPLDSVAGLIHGFSDAWVTARSGLPETLTGRSPGPDGIMDTADDIFEVVGIQDTGFDQADPNDGALDVFDSPNADRVIDYRARTGGAGLADGYTCGTAHGTHVAGIVVSDGYAWELSVGESTADDEWVNSEAGAVPEGKMSFDGIVNGFGTFCIGGLATSTNYWNVQYNDGARAMVNSWGGPIGNYNSNSLAVDDQMDSFDGDGNNDRMIIFAAANEGPDLNTLSGDSQAKNGLGIGASQNFRPDQFNSDNPNLVVDFSSRGGPSQSQGRLKPDLLAIGSSVISLFSRGEWDYNVRVGRSNPQPGYIQEVDEYDQNAMGPGNDGIADYQYLAGTSMAAPMAAGNYLLVREYLREIHSINSADSWLVKALLINGAVRMDEDLYDYPGYDQGWGRINLRESIIPQAPKTVQFEEGTLSSGDPSWTPSTLNLNVDSDSVPLKVTLVYADEPATGGILVRDIDLVVTSPSGTVYRGNCYGTTGALDGWSVPDPTGGMCNSVWDTDNDGQDEVNNVEQVEVETPETGLWQVAVNPFNLPTPAPFAVVVSADIGPQTDYRIALRTDYPTTFSVAPSGSAYFPFNILNFGIQNDQVDIISNAPAGLTVNFNPAKPYAIPSQDSVDVTMRVDASPGMVAGIYCFDLAGRSLLDPATPPAQSTLGVCVEVLTAPLPTPLQVTNGTVDELDPSILVFNDGTVDRILIAYRVTTPVDPGGMTGGVNVRLAMNTLDLQGQLAGSWQYVDVSNVNDDPNDIRLIRIPGGTFANRVVITWTGKDPNVANPDLDSYGRVAFADAPYLTWNLRTMESNVGSSLINTARVSFPLWRNDGNPGGELMWVWEHLDYPSSQADQPSAVQTHAVFSYDGGNTWGTPVQVSPNDSNYYFFPSGVVDQNNIAWIVFYWRTPGGNDRDLLIRLRGNNCWSNPVPVWNTNDNIQWPAPLSTNEGIFGNRVYTVVTRDQQGIDLTMWTTYTDGNYGCLNPPADGPTGGTTGWSTDFTAPRGPFGTAVSNANYDRRPILNIVHNEVDRVTWLPFMETANPYDTPNLVSIFSSDQFQTQMMGSPTILTADAFAKGHQMTNTYTVGGTNRLYETYHESKETGGEVNYDVYLIIYAALWENSVDTKGPVVSMVAGTPNPYNVTAGNILITANCNDATTGNSNVMAAQWVETSTSVNDPQAVSWAGATAMTAGDLTFDSPIEGVEDAASPAWSPGTHRVWVRCQDGSPAQNWGLGDYADIIATGIVGDTSVLPPTGIQASLAGVGYVDVSITWTLSGDDGGGQNDVVAYDIYYATAYDAAGAGYALLDTVLAGTNAYTHAGAGDGDPNDYFYFVEARDNNGNTEPTADQVAKITRPVSTGPQLVAVPVIMSTDPSIVLQTLQYDWVRYFDAGTRQWVTLWQSNRISSLLSVDRTMALWVDVTGGSSLTVAGVVPTSTSISMVTGWNFIGFPAMDSRTVAAVFAGQPVSRVEGYSAPAGPYYLKQMQGTDMMVPGYGYWVYADAAFILSVNN
jgi:hypothetical protein